jgi:hypothetical protein
MFNSIGGLNRFSTMMDKDQIRDVSIHVTDYLLDNMPTLLDEDVLEVDGEYTEGTWMLQDTITEALTLILSK